MGYYNKWFSYKFNNNEGYFDHLFVQIGFKKLKFFYNRINFGELTKEEFLKTIKELFDSKDDSNIKMALNMLNENYSYSYKKKMRVNE